MTGAEFLEWRLRMGLRQEDAGRALGKSRRWVQAVEAAKQKNVPLVVEVTCRTLEREQKEELG